MNEQISALMDGELDAGDAARLVSGIKHDREAARAWSAYQLIGDTLRGETLLATQLGAGVGARLAKEPTILAPRLGKKPALLRHSLPLAASFAAVGFVGIAAWQMVQFNRTPAAPTTLAASAAPSAPAVAVSLRDDKPRALAKKLPSGSSAYLLAHQEFSPSYAMEGTATYVRTVAAEVQDSPR